MKTTIAHAEHKAGPGRAPFRPPHPIRHREFTRICFMQLRASESVSIESSTGFERSEVVLHTLTRGARARLNRCSVLNAAIGNKNYGSAWVAAPPRRPPLPGHPPTHPSAWLPTRLSACLATRSSLSARHYLPHPSFPSRTPNSRDINVQQAS